MRQNLMQGLKRHLGPYSRLVTLGLILLLIGSLSTSLPLSRVASAQDDTLLRSQEIPAEVRKALDALPQANVASMGVDGIPSFINGDLGRVEIKSDPALESELKTALELIAPVFRLRPENLKLRRVRKDELNVTHVRYSQVKNDLDVIGGELVFHINADGVIFAVNGNARDDIDISPDPTVPPGHAAQRAIGERPELNLSAGEPRLVYVISTRDGSMHLAYEVEVKGDAAGMPVHDLEYIDAKDGSFVDRHPLIHEALNRRVHTANQGTVLPGILLRSEGSSPHPDSVVNINYNYLGDVYNCYINLFNRDSYNGAGGALVSTVHYGFAYNNAFWDGARNQMAYGDGDGFTFDNLTKALDVTAHEITHGVTQYESGLIYQNEPGAVNEAMSDIFGAVCEVWKNGGTINVNTWKVGEDIYTPGIAGDAIRYMNNPTADGSSRDYYPERYIGTLDSGGVHWNSGIANLAFKLLVTGGTHPRGRTSINVPAIGMAVAQRIFYRANSQYLTPTSNFESLRAATGQAARDLYDAATETAVHKAWDAVGVPGSQPPRPPAAPSNLTAAAVSSSQINLGWLDNSDNESGFKVERKVGAGGTYAQIANLGPNVTGYSNTALTSSTTYYYRVRAYNSAGDSAYSNEANATTLGTSFYVLTVNRTGTGAGTVTSSPAGISCGTDCTESYADGTVVTLTATPTGASSFAGWGGDLDCVDGVVRMFTARTCAATFRLLLQPPHQVSYSTYLGGTGDDFGTSIAVDSAGNAYVTGFTRSTDFPTVNAVQPAYGGSFEDAFVSKMAPDGRSLIYSTYLGGSGGDDARGIAVDSAGNAYVTGTTSSSNFPTRNPFQPALRGYYDAFVTKLNATGTALVYSTYLGGNSLTGSYDSGIGIAVDASGNAYVMGKTDSSNFPTMNPFQRTYGGYTDAFVTKLNAAGTALLYSTYLGGTGAENYSDYTGGIAVDSVGNAYVMGQTSSPDFPTRNPFQPALRGSGDAFVTKFDAAGTALLYSTYLGGSSDEEGEGIAVDSSGNAYVTGRTNSFNFPTMNPFQRTYGGVLKDVFVTKFNAAGTALVYSTYLGGTGDDFGRDIAVDSAGNAYVTGHTTSPDFPTMNPFQPALGGYSDAFVTKFNAAGTALVYSTYLGGTAGVDSGISIAVGSDSNTYLTGWTDSIDFPTMNPFQPAIRGGFSDAFVTKINNNLQPPPEPIRVVLSRDGGGQLQATITITNPTANPIPGVTLTLARASTLDQTAFVDGAPVPQSFGTVNPGQSVTAVVTFPGTAGVPGGFAGLVRVNLSYTGGTYTETKNVTTP